MRQKIILVFLIISSLFISCTTVNIEESSLLNNEVSVSSMISSIDKYGNVTLNITSKNFFETGFSFGDEVLLETETGLITKAKIFNQYFEKEDLTIITTGIDSQLITISLSLGNFANKGNLKLGNRVKITLINNNSLV